MKSLCIIPCWNEEHRLSNLINQIKNFDQSNYSVDFLFINNGSTDNSLKIIEDSQIMVKSYEQNRGAGYALIDGLKIGIKKNYDVMVHLAANGCLVFTPNTPQMDLLFSQDEVVYFDSLQDFDEKMRHYLAHPDEAKTIAQEGHKRAQKDYDCKVVTATIVKQIFS